MHRVVCRAVISQSLECDDKVSSDGTADAAVHDLDEFFVRLLRQDFLVHPDGAELVLNDSEADTMVRVQDVVEQSRLARTEETSQDGHRHLLRLAYSIGRQGHASALPVKAAHAAQDLLVPSVKSWG